MNGTQMSDSVRWNVGLVNHQGKYMTAEKFGFKINASGANMRKKQLWTIEMDGQEDGLVYIRSHLEKYLATDKPGNVTCDSDEKGVGESFKVKYHEDGSGRWAFQSKLNSCFFGATEDNVLCKEMNPGEAQWFNIRLALHPQVNIRNVNRKKYAHLHIGNGKIQCDEIIPWGQDALITLDYIDGKYAVKSFDGRYLSKDGELVNENNNPRGNKDIQFTLEIHSGQYTGVAFRDNDGKYLTAIGQNAIMQTKNKSVSKDELFTLEDSHPQVFITAHNGKKVSTKQGVDLTANQEVLSDKETFQMEYEKKNDSWKFRTLDNKLWGVGSTGGVQSVNDSTSPDVLYTIEWLSDGQAAIKSTNGKYLTAKMNGSLCATSENVSDKEKYFITIVNRPILVLKCDYGLVGFKLSNNPRIECNKASHDVIYLEHDDGKSGGYFFKGHNGKYWSLDGDCMINANSEEPKPFFIELIGQSKFAIKAPNGSYLKGEQNGIVCAKEAVADKATLWEY